jgi:hypothetical protein
VKSSTLAHPTLVTNVPRLYLGPRPDLLASPPPGRVVSLCETVQRWPDQLRFPLEDTLLPRAVPDRAAFEAFLDEAHRAVVEGPTYWHCHRGLNRSGFALAAYLVRHQRQRVSAAIARLRRLRSPLVLRNEQFERTLRAWYGAPDEQTLGVRLEDGDGPEGEGACEPIPMPPRDPSDRDAVLVDFEVR